MRSPITAMVTIMMMVMAMSGLVNQLLDPKYGKAQGETKTATTLSPESCKITFSGIVDGKKGIQLLDKQERLESVQAMICRERGARGRG